MPLTLPLASQVRPLSKTQLGSTPDDSATTSVTPLDIESALFRCYATRFRLICTNIWGNRSPLEDNSRAHTHVSYKLSHLFSFVLSLFHIFPQSLPASSRSDSPQLFQAPTRFGDDTASVTTQIQGRYLTCSYTTLTLSLLIFAISNYHIRTCPVNKQIALINGSTACNKCFSFLTLVSNRKVTRLW